MVRKGKEANRGKQNWPSWVTPELVSDTTRVWQPYYDQPLTEEDAIEILRNVGRLGECLLEDEGGGKTALRPRGAGLGWGVTEGGE